MNAKSATNLHTVSMKTSSLVFSKPMTRKEAMSRKCFLSLLGTVLLLLCPLHDFATAGCSQVDLSGSWHVFVSSAYQGGCWTRLRISINPRGRITILSISDSYGRKFSTSGTPGGRLILNSACNISGSIVHSDNAYPINIRFDYATLNRSRDTLGAAGTDINAASACTITAYKK